MSADFMETLPAYLEQPSAAKAAKTRGIYGSAEAGPFQKHSCGRARTEFDLQV
jgi:hypothetical protein